MTRLTTTTARGSQALNVMSVEARKPNAGDEKDEKVKDGG